MFQEKYEVIASDYWDHLILVGGDKLKTLDSNFRTVESLFNNPEYVFQAESITYMDNRKLYTLHNNPSMVKVFVPQPTILQTKINLEND